MWDAVGIVAAIVVLLLLLQVLDVAEILKKRLRGEAPQQDLEQRVIRIEERLDRLENAGPRS
jgi:hypothetical protein